MPTSGWSLRGVGRPSDARRKGVYFRRVGVCPFCLGPLRVFAPRKQDGQVHEDAGILNGNNQA